MKLVTLNLPEPYIKALDSLVKAKRFPSRAEAIRIAVRDLILDELTILEDKEAEEICARIKSSS